MILSSFYLILFYYFPIVRMQVLVNQDQNRGNAARYNIAMVEINWICEKYWGWDHF